MNDAFVALLLAASMAAFVVGWARLPVRRNGTRPVPGWRAGLFLLAMLVLAVALLPPLDDLADRHFSAHMAQHLVLLVIAPPMIAASQAQFAFLQLLPLSSRRRTGRFIAGVPGLKFAAHHGSAIWFVCLSSIIVLWFWHSPGAYDLAQRNEAVHDCEHLLFLVTEIAFWRVILFRRERHLPRAGAALLLLVMSVQGGMLAAVITFAQRPLYFPYGRSADALMDQSLGGVMMWIVAGTVYAGGFVILFAQALRRSPPRRHREAILASAAVAQASCADPS